MKETNGLMLPVVSFIGREFVLPLDEKPDPD
jgi:hypothetical protein